MFKKSTKLIFSTVALTLTPLLVGAQVQVGQTVDGGTRSSQFGKASAMSSDGRTFISGSPYHDITGFNNAGGAHIYTYDATGQWIQLGNVIEGSAAHESTGWDVDMSADGQTVIVGAPLADKKSGVSYAGRVTVHTLTGGFWLRKGQKLEGTASNDLLGESVSIDSTGTLIAVGGTQTGGTGFVQLYRFVSGGWSPLGSRLVGASISDRFGDATDISDDGKFLMVGTTNAGPGNQGRVYLYSITASGPVLVSTFDGNASNDQFGFDVDLNEDGSRAIVGARQDRGNSTNTLTGYVQVLSFGGGTLSALGSQIQGTVPNGQFGAAVGISHSGDRIIAGSKGYDNTLRGYAQVYDLVGGSWVQQGVDLLGDKSRSSFGSAVAISSTGEWVLAGARNNNPGGSSRAGQSKVFEFPILLSNKLETFNLKASGSDYSILSWSFNDVREDGAVELEFSPDGINWSTLYCTSMSEESPAFEHVSSASDYNYYRLAVYAEDGTVGYSAIKVRAYEAKQLVQLHPNPATSIIRIAETDVERVVLLNSLGQLVKVVEGEREITVSELNSGKYYVLIYQSEHSVKRASFIKQ